MNHQGEENPKIYECEMTVYEIDPDTHERLRNEPPKVLRARGTFRKATDLMHSQLLLGVPVAGPDNHPELFPITSPDHAQATSQDNHTKPHEEGCCGKGHCDGKCKDRANSHIHQASVNQPGH